ncbi:amidohydrolase family protein [Polycladidibacter stylochi]|uniref:amidohydrolase family protein n=1 Tax=Polycladidibacter stylochi TaxID=1807766 RepID=UPI000834DBE1|nr:amidohydrolase family protein [Pseudovibrio stylochi]
MDHVPSGFLPLGLTRLLRTLPFHRTTSWALRLISPLDGNDLFSRYANFLDIGAKATQEEIFEKLNGYYPANTRFIILPMDMAYMGAGTPAKTLAQQHHELAELALKYPKRLIPFIAVDPRRETHGGENLEEMITKLLEKQHLDGARIFRGIKLYPPLGYLPNDPSLEAVWQLCNDYQLPVMTHCSRGGVKSKDLQKDVAASYADPDHYRKLLKKYPQMRLCLAHFGGAQDWDMYFKDVRSRQEAALHAPDHERRHMNWLTKIMQMIKSGEYPNLYTDISYTVFYMVKYMPALKVFLWDETLRKRTLFGSDYYMAEQEEFEERFLSMRLRAELGDGIFKTIACQNPLEYLGEQPTVGA